MKNQEMFKKFMAGMGEVFGKEISDILFDIYWNALKDFSDEQCKTSFNRAMVQCKFFPKPVELIDMINCERGQLEDIAQIQADIVVNAIKKIGQYQSVKFKDKTTNAVITRCFGSWVKMCEDLEESKEQWFKKDFVKYYQSYKRQGIEEDNVFLGFVAIKNKSEGFEEYIPEPILIDGFDIEKIKLLE